MELDQLEALALAPAAQRERALEQLIPGTEDYYCHRCLFDQRAGRHVEGAPSSLPTRLDPEAISRLAFQK